MPHVLYVSNVTYEVYIEKMGYPLIACPPHGRYDRNGCNRAGAMTDETAAEIEKRLNDGAWLRPGEVATLFGRSRWAVIDWLKKGVLVNGERHFIGFRTSPGGHRELDPADVAKVLAAHRVRRTAEPESGT
jgi:hypothetical protein